jgi:hypothetical protein
MRLFFVSADDPRRLLAVPREGGAPTPLAELPAPIVFGAGGPDGVHLLLHGDGAAEGWLIPAGGTPRLESSEGLVIPAPEGGFRLLGALSGSQLQIRVQPPGGAAVDAVAVLPQWLDGRRFAYVAADWKYHLRDAASGAETVLEAPGRPFQWSSLAPDGKTVYSTMPVGHVTRHLITNFADR